MQNTIIGNKRFPTHVKRYSPIARGTNLYIPVYIKDDKEQPIDLSTLTAHFTIKRVPTDNDFFDDRAFLAKDIDLDNDDGKNGVFHITASSREMFFDPGEYFFDIELFAPETPITPDDPHPERDRGTISRIIELPFTLIGGVTNRKVNSSDNYAANFGQVNDQITIFLSAQSQPIVVVTPPFIDTKVAHSWDNPLLVDGFWYDSIGYLRWPDLNYQIQASDATVIEVEQNRQLSYEYLKLEQDPTTTFWTLSVYNTKANPADWEEIGHTEDGTVRNWQWTWLQPYSWNSLFKEGQISGIPESSNFWMAFDGHLTAETRNQDALVGKLQSLYNTLISVRSDAARQQATSSALLFKNGLWYDNMLSFDVATAGLFVEENDVQVLSVVNNGMARDFLRMDKVGASGCELYYAQNGTWELAGQVASGDYASWQWEPFFPQTIINGFQSSFITARGPNAANISKSEFWNKMVFNIHYDTSDIVPVLNKFYGLYAASGGGGGGGLPGTETDPIYTADKPNIAFKNTDFTTTLTSTNKGATMADLPDTSGFALKASDFTTTLTSANKGATMADLPTMIDIDTTDEALTLTSNHLKFVETFSIAQNATIPTQYDFQKKDKNNVVTVISSFDIPSAQTITIDSADENLVLSSSNALKFVETLSVATSATNPNHFDLKKTNKSNTTTTWGSIDVPVVDTSGLAIKATDFTTALTSANKGATMADLPDVSGFIEATDFVTTLTSINKGITQNDLPDTSGFALKSSDFVSTLTTTNKGITQSDLPSTTDFALKSSDFVSTLTTSNKGITQSDLPNLSNYVETTDFLTTLTSINKGITQSDFHTALTSTNKGITQNDFYGTISSSNKGATMSDLPDTSLFALKASDFQTALTSTNKGATMSDLPDVSGFALKASDFVSTLTSTNKGITQSDLPSTADFALKSTDFQTTLTSVNKGATIADLPNVSGFVETTDFVTTLTSTNKGISQNDITNFANKTSDFQTTLTSTNKGATMSDLPDTSGFALKVSDFVSTLTSTNKGITQSDLPNTSNFVEKTDFVTTLTTTNKGITQSDLPDTSGFAVKASDFVSTLTTTNKGITQSDLPDTSGFALKVSDFVSTLTTTNKGITQSDLPDLSDYVETTDFLTTLTTSNKGITQNDFQTQLTSTNKGVTIADLPDLSDYVETTDFLTTLTTTNKGITQNDLPDTSGFALKASDFTTTLTSANKGATMADLPDISGFALKATDFVSTLTSSNKGITQSDLPDTSGFALKATDFVSTLTSSNKGITQSDLPDLSNYVETTDFLTTLTSINKGITQDDFQTTLTSTNKGATMADLPLIDIDMTDVALTLTSGHLKFVETLNVVSSTTNSNIVNFTKTDKNSNTTTWGTIDFGAATQEHYLASAAVKDIVNGDILYSFDYLSTNNNSVTTFAELYQDMVSSGYNESFYSTQNVSYSNTPRIPVSVSASQPDIGVTVWAIMSGHDDYQNIDGFAIFCQGGTGIQVWDASSPDFELMTCKKRAISSLARPQKYMTHLTIKDGAGAKYYSWSYISNSNNIVSTTTEVIDDMISSGYPMQPASTDAAAPDWFRIPISSSFDHTVATNLSDFGWPVSMSLRYRNPGNVRAIQLYSSIPGNDSNGNGALYITETNQIYSVTNCTKIPL